jgi:hypothetical protein
VRQRKFGHVEAAIDIGAKGTLDLRGFDGSNIVGLVLLGGVEGLAGKKAALRRSAERIMDDFNKSSRRAA